jgi:hypothetical protein
MSERLLPLPLRQGEDQQRCHAAKRNRDCRVYSNGGAPATFGRPDALATDRKLVEPPTSRKSHLMCGRYALHDLEQFPGSWNVVPTHMMPITRLRDGAVDQITARWGCIPHWAKDGKIGFKCINARAETVATVPSFRGAHKFGRRCLVPASGFFEWEARPDGKQPFCFTSPEGSLLAFAGLCDKWKKSDGTEVLS